MFGYSAVPLKSSIERDNSPGVAPSQKGPALGVPGAAKARGGCRLVSTLLMVLCSTIISAPPKEPGGIYGAAPQALAKAGIRQTHLQSSLIQGIGKVPLSFEKNLGQVDDQVKFLARGFGFSLFLTPTEVLLRPLPPSPAAPDGLRFGGFSGGRERSHARSHILKMEFVGANSAARISGIREIAAKSHYYLGNDAGKWLTDVPNYAGVQYEQVYPGIDLVYYGNQERLEYDLVVAPGADPGAICLAFAGTTELKVDASGDLLMAIPGGGARLCKPVAFQLGTGGSRREIDAEYVLEEEDRVRLRIAEYDPAKRLVIDPLILFSSYLGGQTTDWAEAITLDASGIYLTGHCSSADFPSLNPLPGGSSAGGEAFVTKLTPSGDALVYSTCLGGNSYDQARAIAVDATGNAFVAGVTQSTDFPLVNAYQSSFRGSSTDAFMARLNGQGNLLVFSSYLGGDGDESVTGICLRPSGGLCVVGYTASGNFPLRNALQVRNGGERDAFVSEFAADGSALLFSTYLGGRGNDCAYAAAAHPAGDVYLAGYSDSGDFPLSAPLQPAHAGSGDSFLTRLNPTSGALIFSTYLGGSAADYANGIAVDTSGNSYLTGYTASGDFPTSHPFQSSRKGSGTAFVAKIDAAGKGLAYATYLGGSHYDEGRAVAVDSSGSAHVAGITRSTDFPAVNALQGRFAGGGGDAFITKFSADGQSLSYSTYLGGSGLDFARAIALDLSGNILVVGETESSDFPIVRGFQAANAGHRDAFIAQIGEVDCGLGIQLGKSGYADGEMILATAFRLSNSGDQPAQVELKVWLGIPTLGALSILNVGGDGSFVLPARFEHDFAPLALFMVTSALPRGTYELSSRTANPVTLELISESLNAFEVR